MICGCPMRRITSSRGCPTWMARARKATPLLAEERAMAAMTTATTANVTTIRRRRRRAPGAGSLPGAFIRCSPDTRGFAAAEQPSEDAVQAEPRAGRHRCDGQQCNHLDQVLVDDEGMLRAGGLRHSGPGGHDEVERHEHHGAG